MDIFKQNRNLTLVVIILVILNIVTLTFLWLGKPQNPPLNALVRNPIEEQNRIKTLLKNELRFDDKQADEYLELRKNHKQAVDKLQSEIQRIKKQMFDEALKEGAKIEISDSLLNLSQTKQAEIEHLTFQHFVKLKNLCKPDQRDRLKRLIHKLLKPEPEGKMPVPPQRQLERN
jgi:periplasmic protein CpxP/Spy